MKIITTNNKKDKKDNEDNTTNYENLVRMTSSTDKGITFSKLEERVTSTISKNQLETLYHIDGITFRDVNDYMVKVVSPGFYLTGDDNLIKISNNWFDNIRIIPLLKEVFKDIFICGAGNAWLELGYNKVGNDIPKVKILNPKYMDYIRDDKADKNVVLDDDGEPIGFRKDKSANRDKAIWKKDIISINDKVVWTAIGDQDGRDRIAHFKLFGLGESYLGMSPTETVYKSAIIRLNIEDSIGNSVARSGGIIATVGKENEPAPKPETMDGIVKDLQDVDSQTVFGFPNGVKVDGFPSPDLRDKADLLLYFAGIQGLCMGIPISRHMLPGSRISIRGQENLSMDMDYEQRIIDLQESLAEQIREKLLFRMLKARGLVTEYYQVPKIKFNSSTPYIITELVNQIARLSRRDMVRRDPELEKFLRDKLGIPKKYLEREIEQWEIDSTKIPTTPQIEKNLDSNKDNKAK